VGAGELGDAGGVGEVRAQFIAAGTDAISTVPACCAGEADVLLRLAPAVLFGELLVDGLDTGLKDCKPS
jgi:hypothetical protein